METVKEKRSHFDQPPDPEAQKHALISALQIVEGFALYFVVSDPARTRPKLMDEVEQAVAPEKVQRIAVTTETRNLLHLLREQLTDPLPDAVFIYGLENWISGAVPPRSIEFILNLNVTRNHFYTLLPKPMVFWVPVHVMNAIIGGAPDFFSVRSGAYTFPLTQDERAETYREITARSWTAVEGIRSIEKNAEIHRAENLLATFKSLPTTEQNPSDEARLLSSLGALYLSEGDLREAEPLFIKSLQIRQDVLPPEHPSITTGLNDLAELRRAQGNYDEAEKLHLESLRIRRQVLPIEHPSIATSLSNLAEVYIHQGRLAEAESLYQAALHIDRQAYSNIHPEVSTDLSCLAKVYLYQGRFSEAEPLLIEALKIDRQILPPEHPRLACILNDLAELYRLQGRYAEAAILFGEASEIFKKSLGKNHPNMKIFEENLKRFFEEVTANHITHAPN